MSIRLFANERFKAAAKSAALLGNGMRVTVIEGASGSGKSLMARYLASSLLCEGGKDKLPCGECRPCRLIAEGIHPDVILPEKDRKKVISVDAVKRLRRDAFVQPTMALRKVYLFERAEELNTEGQNALLKLLEEPPANTYFILLCLTRTTLLPTVLSRAALFSAEPLSDADLAVFLREKAPDATADAISSACRLAGGNAGRALSLLTEGSEIRSKALAYLKAAARHDEYGLYKSGAALAADPQIDLRAFLFMLKELLSLSARDAAGLGYAGEDTVPSFGKENAYALLEALDAIMLWPEANLSAPMIFTGMCAAFSAILNK